MDIKKQQFHLANLNAKKLKLSNNLDTLSAQLSLLTTQQNATESSSADDANTLYNQYNQLQMQKASHIDTLKQTQIQITDCFQQKSQLQNTIKSIPLMKEAEIVSEQRIYTEELERINQLIIENNNAHIDVIYNEFDNKQALKQAIDILQTQLSTTTDTIIHIQEDAHKQRQTSITKLKQQKATKQNYQLCINTYNQQITYLNTQINALETQNTTIQTVKATIIANFYITDTANTTVPIDPTVPPVQPVPPIPTDTTDTSTDTSSDTVLLLQELTIDPSLFNTLSINNKITLLDKHINSNTYQIQRLHKSLSMVNRPDIPECLKTLQGGSINSIYSCKDSYKACKTECTGIEKTLNNSICKINGYDSVVIGECIAKYSSDHDDLQGEITYAKQRLSIMLERIDASFNSKSIVLQDQVTEMDNQLTLLVTLIANYQTQIAALDTLISSQYATITAINDIKLKIENIKVQLSQIDNDIYTILLPK